MPAEMVFRTDSTGKTQAEYVAIMNGLNLPNPKLMDVAVPANLACGKV
jgi:hypothetical protein